MKKPQPPNYLKIGGFKFDVLFAQNIVNLFSKFCHTRLHLRFSAQLSYTYKGRVQKKKK